MASLTEQDLVQLNLKIQEYFKIKTGIQQAGLLNSASERPDQLYYGKELFPDIYTKAASIFEALTRWHIFSDLNKRTALIATRTYFDINDYLFLVPLSAVRFSVKVAADKNTIAMNHLSLLIKSNYVIRWAIIRKIQVRVADDFLDAVAKIQDDYVKKKINEVAYSLEQDIKVGDYVKNRPYPKKYRAKVSNLYRVRISSYRLIYTITGTSDRIIYMMLDFLTHNQYDKLFGYKTN